MKSLSIPYVAFNSASRASAARNHRAISQEVISGLLKILDFGGITFTAFAAFSIYIRTFLGNNEPFDRYALTSLISATLFVVGIDRVDGCAFKKLSSFRWQATRGLVIWGVSVSSLLLLAFLTKQSSNYSRGWTLTWICMNYGAFLINRSILWLLLKRWARQGLLVRNVVVVGAGKIGARLVARLQRIAHNEVAILGVFDDCQNNVPSQVGGIPVLGTTSDLLSFARNVLIDEVVVAMPLTDPSGLKSLFGKLSQLPADLKLSVDCLADAFPVRGLSYIGDTPVIKVIDRPLRNWSALTKWFEDKILGFLLLICFAPLMGIIAVLILLDSRGGVFFIQERFGFNQIIRVFKFRTMYANKGDTSGAERTLRNDPRVTRLGRVLRATSLDELPQLINVVRGEMSLVGPRPHAITMRAGGELYYDAVGEYLHRHRVKPGITGWAQVNGQRGEIDTIEKARARVEYDLRYIDNWSLWMDIKILLMSFRVLFARENAY